MATYYSNKVLNENFYPSAAPHSAREIYVVTSETIFAASPKLDVGDVVQLAILPPNCVPCGVQVMSNQLDTGNTLRFYIGILTEDKTELIPTSICILSYTGAQLEVEGDIRVASDNTYEGIYRSAAWLDEAECPAITQDKILAAVVADEGGATGGHAGSMFCRMSYRAIEVQDKPLE